MVLRVRKRCINLCILTVLFLLLLQVFKLNKCGVDACMTNREKVINKNISKIITSSMVTNQKFISNNENRTTKNLDKLLKVSEKYKDISSKVKKKNNIQVNTDVSVDNVGKKISNKNSQPSISFNKFLPKTNITNLNKILKSKQTENKVLNKSSKLQPYVFFKELRSIASAKNITKPVQTFNNFNKTLKSSKAKPTQSMEKHTTVPKQGKQGKVNILKHNLSKKIPHILVQQKVDKTKKINKQVIDKFSFKNKLGQQVEGSDDPPPPDNEKPNGGPPTENETPNGGPPPDSDKPNGGGPPTESGIPPPNNPPNETPNGNLPPDAEIIPSTEKSTGKPAIDQPVTKPIDKPTEAPKGVDKPNTTSPDKPLTTPKPTDKPDDKPGNKSTDKPGDKEGEKPVVKDKPNDISTIKPPVQPSEVPAKNKTEDNPNDKPNNKTNNPEEKSTTTPKPADKPGDKEGEKPLVTDKTNETSTSKPKVQPSEVPVTNKTEDKPIKGQPGVDKPNNKSDDTNSTKPTTTPKSVDKPVDNGKPTEIPVTNKTTDTPTKDQKPNIPTNNITTEAPKKNITSPPIVPEDSNTAQNVPPIVIVKPPSVSPPQSNNKSDNATEKPMSTPKPVVKPDDKEDTEKANKTSTTIKPQVSSTAAPKTNKTTDTPIKDQKPNITTNNDKTTEAPKKEGSVPPKGPEVTNTPQVTPPVITEKTPSVIPPPGKPQGVNPPGNPNGGPNAAPSPGVEDAAGGKPQTTLKPTVIPNTNPNPNPVPNPTPSVTTMRPVSTLPPPQPTVMVVTPAPTTQKPHPNPAGPEDKEPEPTKRPGKGSTTTATPGNATEPPPAIKFVFWNWEVFGFHFTCTGLVIIILMLRVAFRSIHFLSSRIPEPCLMIGLGAVVVLVLKLNRFKLQDDPTEITGDEPRKDAVLAEQKAPTKSPAVPTTTPEPTKEPPPIGKFSMPPFTAELYFLVLVPPTVLEAAYSLHDSAFLENLYPILLLSVVCKLTSMFAIAYLLVYADKLGYMGSLEKFGAPVTNNYSLTLSDSLLFTSVLTGVDASPVLDILEDAAVNKDLFYILLGESLLNDAVTTTMYSTVNNLADKDLNKNQHLYFQTVAFFVYVSIGGMAVGIIAGFITAIFTRLTTEFRIVEPLLLLCIAYISYILSEMVGVSGQTCMIACGLVQAHYAFKNISSTSNITVRYFIKILSSTSDAVIFVFLGLSTLGEITDWHTGFFLWSLGSSFFLRFFVVFVLIGLYNLLSYRYVRPRDQIIISYCGIRGSVCFCLMHMINGEEVGPRKLFGTTMIIIIIWTALVQGGTIKYLIEVLDIERDKLKTMNEEVHENIFSMMMNGIETISTVHQDSIFIRFFKWVDNKILMRILVNKDLREDSALRELSEKLEQDYSRKPIWMMPIPKTPIKEEPRTESPHVTWDLDRPTVLNNKAPFSIRDQPWLPGIPPDQQPRSEPWSIRETPWLPGIPTNSQARHEPFSIKEQPWLPGIPLNMPKRRQTQALPHNLSDTLREAMRNTPFQRMQYHNERRAVEESFQNASPLNSSSDSLPNLNLRRGQVLLEMQEVAGRRQPVTSGDLRRRLFVAQMCMPQRRRSQEPGNRQQTPTTAPNASPQKPPSRRPSNKK